MKDERKIGFQMKEFWLWIVYFGIYWVGVLLILPLGFERMQPRLWLMFVGIINILGMLGNYFLMSLVMRKTIQNIYHATKGGKE